MKALIISTDSAPHIVDIGPDSYRGLAARFPDGFDSLRLARGVDAYVGDCSLIDGSPHNDAGTALADDCYRAVTGEPCHVDIHGLAVILGTTEYGTSVDVPAEFIAAHDPHLTEG